MLNEWQEFRQYAEPPVYAVAHKSDTAYLGRFTFDTLLDFEGLARVLTIIARGYLFHDREGAILAGDPRTRLGYARRALCAWCSLPDAKNAAPREEWQYKTNFAELHEAFPELVDEKGGGWFWRHAHGVADFILTHPEQVRKTALPKAVAIRDKFDPTWRNKLRQFQTPLFNMETKGAWGLRFDDVLADAIELGPLRRTEPVLPDELLAKIDAVLPKEVPLEVVATLIAYYAANKPDDSDWVVLPVAGFDAYFGSTLFSRKLLRLIPPSVIERADSGFGVCRYKVPEKYLH